MSDLDQMWDEVEEEDREPEKFVKLPNGNPAFFVAVYEADRVYGGPEEGGWWFDTGDLIETYIATSREEAEGIREALRDEYPRTGRRNSVIYDGCSDWDIIISEGKMPVEHYPEVHPHYE